MTINIPTYSEKILNKFAEEQWEKALAFLQKQYSMSMEDCKDVFQDSFIALYNNNKNGKLEGLDSSLSTYFLGICKFKAHEKMRNNGRKVKEDDKASMTLMDGGIKEDKITAIIETFDNEVSITERKEAMVRQIIRELPSPCNELLWGFYRDNLSMKALAEMYNYSIGSIKVIKHRCMDKFRMNYTKLIKHLY